VNDNRDSGQSQPINGGWRNPHSISAVQFAAITAAAREDGVLFETEPPDGPPHYIWQRDHILVDPDVDENTNDHLVKLGAVLAPNPGGGQQLIREDLVKVLRLEKPQGFGELTTAQIVERLNATDDLSGKVFVNNLMYVTHGDGANLCPASEPTPVRPYPMTQPYPPPSQGNAGAGVRVTVIDTGLSPDWQVNHPWLYEQNKPVEVQGVPEDTYEIAETQEIAPHAGHGMFIAGLIRCVAPRANVTVMDTMKWAGAMTEAAVAQAIMSELDKRQPDIISLSAGYMIHERPGGGPKAMLDVMRRLSRQDCRTVLVAATGNDAHGPKDHGLFYPAAFAAEHGYVSEGMLVAVGALRADRAGRACFSNYGDWVTVYEDGENLVNAFPTGRYTYREPLSASVPPKCTYYPANPIQEGCTCLTAPAQGSVALFNGMAAWSGTSFATPLVVGRIARHMTETPGLQKKPRAAVQDLLKERVTITDAGDNATQLTVFPQPPGS
jgi:subtilisin family serine protease